MSTTCYVCPRGHGVTAGAWCARCQLPRCAECGACPVAREARATVEECRGCGASFTTTADADFCPVCAAENAGRVRRCRDSECGTVLSDDEPGPYCDRCEEPIRAVRFQYDHSPTVEWWRITEEAPGADWFGPQCPDCGNDSYTVRREEHGTKRTAATVVVCDSCAATYRVDARPCREVIQ